MVGKSTCDDTRFSGDYKVSSCVHDFAEPTKPNTSNHHTELQMDRFQLAGIEWGLPGTVDNVRCLHQTGNIYNQQQLK